MLYNKRSILIYFVFFCLFVLRIHTTYILAQLQKFSFSSFCKGEHTVQYFSGGEYILQGRICFTGVNIIYRGEYSEYFVQERIYFTLEKIIFCFSFRPVTESSNVYYATVCYYLVLFYPCTDDFECRLCIETKNAFNFRCEKLARFLLQWSGMYLLFLSIV